MSHRFLTVAVCTLLAAAPLQADDAQDQAVKAVEKLGGAVVRERASSPYRLLKFTYKTKM